MHQSLPYIGLLLAVLLVSVGGVVAYQKLSSSQPKSEWKTRTILRNGQYIEERFREANANDIKIQQRDVQRKMVQDGRL